MNKKFLITGGTGFIGSNIANMLVSKGYDVVIFDNNHRGKIKRIDKKHKNIKVIQGDIRSLKDLSKAFKNINAVIHLAYINGTKYFYSKPDLVLDVAVKGLINVFDLCLKYKVKEMYLASSSEVYHMPKKIPTDENETLKIPNIFNPRYSYGGGKILTELYGANFGKKYFKKLIIFRPHNVYGPDMGNEHVIPELFQRFHKTKKNKTLKIQGKGSETRSFIHISDFCEAIYLLIKKGKHLNIYNIGTSERVKIIKILKILEKFTSKKIKIIEGPLKIGGTKHRCPNIDKITKLGFKQKINLENGLKKIYKKNYINS
jgi:nucleoside-diphosphate-sugar epimerase|tara:strand:+ start:404 stop:1351 length:948 start_codon:yes stop_codon:yes gene_type:complete